MNTITCEEIEKDKLFAGFKAEASLGLRAFERYLWQYYTPLAGDPKPKLGGSDPIWFMNEFETPEFTLDQMMREIWDHCTFQGAGPCKNAECIAIDYMSSVIAHWEFKAYRKELGK
jgi:hypothetical protein